MKNENFLVPIGKRVLVLPDKPAEKTEGGLFLPVEAKEAHTKGIIVAIGEDPSIIVKKGDHVWFTRKSFREYPYKGETYLLMNESELIAIITPEPIIPIADNA